MSDRERLDRLGQTLDLGIHVAPGRSRAHLGQQLGDGDRQPAGDQQRRPQLEGEPAGRSTAAASLGRQRAVDSCTISPPARRLDLAVEQDASRSSPGSGRLQSIATVCFWLLLVRRCEQRLEHAPALALRWPRGRGRRPAGLAIACRKLESLRGRERCAAARSAHRPLHRPARRARGRRRMLRAHIAIAAGPILAGPETRTRRQRAWMARPRGRRCACWPTRVRRLAVSRSPPPPGPDADRRRSRSRPPPPPPASVSSRTRAARRSAQPHMPSLSRERRPPRPRADCQLRARHGARSASHAPTPPGGAARAGAESCRPRSRVTRRLQVGAAQRVHAGCGYHELCQAEWRPTPRGRVRGRGAARKSRTKSAKRDRLPQAPPPRGAGGRAAPSTRPHDEDLALAGPWPLR